MQITSKFTIAVHIITAIDYFKDSRTVTSSFLAGSVGCNPVIVRNIMGELKAAGLISVSQGRSGISLARDVTEITLYDVYAAVGCAEAAGLFHFHENPNANCPVGRTIHKAMDPRLEAAQQALEESLRGMKLAEVIADTRKELQKESS